MKKIIIAFVILTVAGAAFASRIPAGKQFPSGRYVPGMLIVKLNPELRGKFPALTKAAARSAFGIPGLDGICVRHGITRIEPAFYDPNIALNKLAVKHGLDLMYVVYFDAKADVKSVWSDFAAQPAVATASPNGIREYCYMPNDPQIGNQWHIAKTQCPAAWDVTQGDSTVVLAIVDSGCDWTHPDLNANMWTNADEDINHNGKFDNWPSTYDSLGTYGDLDGIDNEGNGLIDDVVGWDFTDGDNNPYPDGDPEDHGTHCNGCAAATTDNGIGVAGPGFNCRRIGFRCTAGGTGIDILAAINGMYYAVQHRATVISLSWGGYAWYPEEQATINYAWDNGAVIVAAAGNDDVSDPHFPSALPNVIAVAATAPSDAKSGASGANSNFGAWVDIASPGENILSTVPNGNYESWAGTSMATPIVAGVVGLIRSVHPDWTNVQIESQLKNTADNIDAQNPTYIGKLGSGRVNAYRAVSTAPVPRLVYSDHSFVETAGNGNGRIDPGETVALTVLVQNLWGDALAVQGTLSTTDRFVSVTAASSGFGSIENRINGGQTRGNSTPFALQIAANAPNHVVPMVLHLTATGYDTTITFNLNLGRTGILLVNDGEGYPGYPYDPDPASTSYQPESFGDRPLDKFYTSSFDTQGYRYDIWKIARQQPPSLAKLRQYGSVFWFTEWTSPSIDSANIDTIRAYLDQGGGLFISGQDLGWEADYYANVEPDPAVRTDYLLHLYTDYIHAQFGGDAAESQGMTGIAGDPIGDSIACNFWQPYFSSTYQFADYFTPIGGATASINYNGSGGQIGLSKYAGSYRVVYMPIGLESVNNNQAGSVTYDATRSKLAGRIARWLGGNIVIGHTPASDVEDSTAAITITAAVTGDNTLDHTTLYWMRKSEGSYHADPMTALGGDQYQAVIPALNAADSLFYFIYADDASGFANTAPVDGPSRTYALYVGPDLVPPVVAFGTLPPDTMELQGPYPVSAYVTDNLGVDPGSVMVHYYRQGEPQDSAAMSYGGGNRYDGQLTFGSYGKLNQHIYYYVTARDTSHAHNIGISGTHSFNLKDSLYYDDFTVLDTMRWSPGLWVDTSYGAPPSAPNGMKTQRADKYSPSQQSMLTQLDHFNLEPYMAVQLRFKSKRYLDIDADIRDTCYVQASNDTGATWRTLAAYSGNATSWATMTLSLDSLQGFCWRPEARHVQLRFFFKADAEADTNFGWFIDDIKLKAAGPYYGVTGQPIAATVPARLALSPAWPNPMSAKATIKLQLPVQQKVGLDVYNVLGQHVRTLVDGVLAAGSYGITWDGADQHGRKVTNGVYFYQLRAGGEKQTQKIVIIR